jgi:hypothetical protein
MGEMFAQLLQVFACVLGFKLATLFKHMRSGYFYGWIKKERGGERPS